MTEDRSKAFWAKCQCGHIWAAAYYPTPVHLMAKILKSVACPKCGERKKVYPAKQDDGVLQEPTEAA